MSGLKRNHEDVDPDYADVCYQQNKRQRALEEDAKEAVCQRIQNIIKSEFIKEINSKESELQQVDKHLNEARLMMDRLRACVVATYYGQINNASFAQPSNANGPPSSIHPAVKKFIGKAPSHQTTFDTLDESNDQRETFNEKFKANSVGHEIKPKVNFIGSSSTSQHSPTASSVNTNSAPNNVITPASMAYDDRRSRFKIKKKIIVGNVSKYIPVDHREANDMSSHKWMVYVRGPRSSPDISGFVRKVWFFLHHSYKPNDLVEISSPPFHLTRRGWGEFPVRVQLHFVDPRNKKVDVIHHLKLDKTFTGLQTPGAETVVEVELEKDFFGMAEITTIKLVNQTDRTSEKLAHSGLPSSTNKVNHSNMGTEANSETKDAKEAVVPDGPAVSVHDDYNVTIAHEESEDNIVDVGGDVKPTFPDLVSPGNSSAAPKQTLTVIEKPVLVKQEGLTADSAMQNTQSVNTNTRSINTNIVSASNACVDETPVIKTEQVFTVIPPVFPSVSISKQSAALCKPNVSQANIILVPNSSAPTPAVAKSNITILDGPSVVPGKTSNSLTAMQKLIFLHPHTQASSKLETTSTSKQPQILLQTSGARPQIIQQQASVVRQPQIVKQTSLIKPTAPKQVSLLTGRVVESAPTATQHIIPPTTQISSSLLPQRPQLVNSSNQTIILNKATNQFMFVNKSTPQTTEPANPLTDLNGHVLYPCESLYPKAVRVANPSTISMRFPKQISLLKNMNLPTLLNGSNQSSSSIIHSPHRSLSTMSSLDPLLTCPKMSAVGITKHGRNYLKNTAIKVEKTEEERKLGQYEILKAWKQNPELYERNSVKAKKNVLLARDLIEGEAEDIPELITEDYPSLSALLKDAVKLHPLIQENVNKLTHPYCAQSLDQWSSWPIGKQRACEWHRACFVLKYLKACLKNKTEFRGEKLKSTRELVKWCRLKAFSPSVQVPSFHGNMTDSKDTYPNSGDSQPSSFTPVGDLERKLTSYKINEDTVDVELELDIVNIESDKLQCKIKKEIEDVVYPGSIQFLPSSEGSSFVDEQLRKRGLRLDPTELETGIYSFTVMDMLYKVMLEFTSDILREASSVISLTQKSTDQVLTRQIVHTALNNLPEANFCCDKFLGKEDEENR